MIPANQMLAGPGKRMVDKGCASIDFWTPEKVLEPVRAYFRSLGLDGIELDPATDPSNPTKAAAFFTPETDGLRQPWVDGTFLNPPYGNQLYLWVPKIAEEAARGINLVALLPGQRFDQAYWTDHLVCASALTAIVLVTGRVAFRRPDGSVAKGNPYGSMLYVFNGTLERAAAAFAPLGAVLGAGHCWPWAPADPKARARAAKEFRCAQERARQGLLFGAAGRIAAPRPASSAPPADLDPWETALEAAYDAARDHEPGGFPRGGTED